MVDRFGLLNIVHDSIDLSPLVPDVSSVRAEAEGMVRVGDGLVKQLGALLTSRKLSPGEVELGQVSRVVGVERRDFEGLLQGSLALLQPHLSFLSSSGISLLKESAAQEQVIEVLVLSKGGGFLVQWYGCVPLAESFGTQALLVPDISTYDTDIRGEDQHNDKDRSDHH